MQAIQYQRYGDYSTNQLVDMASPAFSEEGVLVRMKFAGVNPLDNTFRSGHFLSSVPQNLPRIGGQTGVGVVEASASPRFKAGDRVFVMGLGYGIVKDGTWRESLIAQDTDLTLIPDQTSYEEAAAFLAGGGYLTGYLALKELANFRPGQTVLAPGIGGAVGMETYQIAEQLGASLVLSTAGTTAKTQIAHSAGYANVIDLSSQDVSKEVHRLTEGKGVDVVVDGIAGDLYPQLLKSLAFKGSYIVVGYAAGRDVQQSVTDVIWKAASVRGFNPRAFSPASFVEGLGACVQMLAKGNLRPTVAKSFSISEAAQAVEYLVEERPFGRVLLRIGDE